MRTAAFLPLLPALALALSPSSVLQSPADSNNATAFDTPDGVGLDFLELVRRDTDPNSCANGYKACTNINSPGLCCRNDQNCAIDQAGHPACCPIGSACTGTIAPVNQATPAPTGSNTNTPAPTTTAGTPFTTTDPFIQGTTVPGSAGRSTVPNTYFPFAFIPTTYTDAAACSSAYTSCQADAARCTAALADGQNGVAINAPNGGVTVTAVPSLGPSSASSICSSLSKTACYELQVEACASFGASDDAPRACAQAWGLPVGVALGIAGQMLT